MRSIYFCFAILILPIFFVACVSFYFLACIMRVHFLLGIFGAIAFAYGTHMPILTIAGHQSKIMSIGFMPYLLGCFLLVFQKRYWLGSSLGLLSASALFSHGHYQIIFYTLVMIAFLYAGYIGKHIYQKTIKEKAVLQHIMMSMGAFILIISVGVMKNASGFLATKDYATVSIRGGSTIVNTQEAATNGGGQTGGSDDNGVGKEYAFNWSVMPSEFLTFITPDIYGAASGKVLGEKSRTYETVLNLGLGASDALHFAQSVSTYWGEQPFTVGPIYFGIIILILVIFSFFYYRSWHLFWLVPVSVFAICMALGKYLPFVNYTLYDYLPYYNKFRSPSMALCIPQLTFPLLSILVLQQLCFPSERKDIFDIPHLRKAVKGTLYVLAALVGVIILFYWGASFSDPVKDQEVMQWLLGSTQNNKDLSATLMKVIRADRKGLLGANILRFFLYAGLFLALMWYWHKKKIGTIYMLIACLGLYLVDVLQVDVKYLTWSDFTVGPRVDEEGKPANDNNTHFPLRDVDEYILQDKDSNYRVLDLSQGSPFTNNAASYYHRSLGGYYAAKLSIYQDLIDSHIRKLNPRVLAMLNTKYVILKGKHNRNEITILDPLGSAWLVSSIKYTPDTYQEIRALNDFNPKSEAVIEQSFKQYITDPPVEDPDARIINTLSRYDTMEYESSSKQAQLAVFSEIYCNKGWRAYIDGKEAPIIKANFALRALSLPKGNHHIRFVFYPTIFEITKKVEVWSALLSCIIILTTLYVERKHILGLFTN